MPLWHTWENRNIQYGSKGGCREHKNSHNSIINSLRNVFFGWNCRCCLRRVNQICTICIQFLYIQYCRQSGCEKNMQHYNNHNKLYMMAYNEKYRFQYTLYLHFIHETLLTQNISAVTRVDVIIVTVQICFNTCTCYLRMTGQLHNRTWSHFNHIQRYKSSALRYSKWQQWFRSFVFFTPLPYWYKIRIVFFLIIPSIPIIGNAPALHFARMLRMLEGWIRMLEGWIHALVHLWCIANRQLVPGWRHSFTPCACIAHCNKRCGIV